MNERQFGWFGVGGFGFFGFGFFGFVHLVGFNMGCDVLVLLG